MRRAVYAGSFDPITFGHMSVVERAAALFDQLVVLVAVNPIKKPLFSTAERVALIRASTTHLPNVTVADTLGYIVDYAAAQGATHLVRGIRDARDWPTEYWLAELNHRLAPGIETIFMPARATLTSVSSSRLKAAAVAGEPLDALCPAPVAAALRRIYAEVDHAGL